MFGFMIWKVSRGFDKELRRSRLTREKRIYFNEKIFKYEVSLKILAFSLMKHSKIL